MSRKPFPLNNCCDFISTIDIFGDKEPWEIFTGPTNQENHFFTRLKNARQTRAKPVGKGGMWKAYEKSSVFDSRNEPIGSMKKFNYFNRRNANKDGKWILEEYTIADKFACCVKDECQDYSFCTLKKLKYPREVMMIVVLKRNIFGISDSFFDEMLRENNSVSVSRFPKRFGIDQDMMN